MIINQIAKQLNSYRFVWTIVHDKRMIIYPLIVKDTHTNILFVTITIYQLIIRVYVCMDLIFTQSFLTTDTENNNQNFKINKMLSKTKVYGKVCNGMLIFHKFN